MSRTATRSVVSALVLSFAAVAGTVHAAVPAETHAGDRYGYEFGTRHASRQSDTHRLVAGLDRDGVSGSPARGFDVYTDGARA